MPPTEKNPDSSFEDDTNFSFKKLTEEDNDSIVSSNKCDKNSRKPVKNVHKEMTKYCMRMCMGWLSGFLYLMVLLTYFDPRFFNGKEFIEPCNGINVISIDDYNLLKEDIAYIQEEMKIINFTIRHNLFNEDLPTLNKKSEIYAKKLTDLNATLFSQRQQLFECYKENVEKHRIADWLFGCATTVFIFLNLISVFIMIKVYKNGPTPKQMDAIQLCVAVYILMFFAAVIGIYTLYYDPSFNKMSQDFLIKKELL